MACESLASSAASWRNCASSAGLRLISNGGSSGAFEALSASRMPGGIGRPCFPKPADTMPLVISSRTRKESLRIRPSCGMKFFDDANHTPYEGRRRFKDKKNGGEIALPAVGLLFSLERLRRLA